MASRLLLHALAVVFTAGTAVAAGPIGKFDEKPPKLNYFTPRAMWDVERCLIDTQNAPAPFVYRQPDRPGAEILIWTKPNGVADTRIDLRASGGGTEIRSWTAGSFVQACAPPGDPPALRR